MPKISALTALASPSYDDLMYVVDDPLGVLPVSKKVTVQNLFAGVFNVKHYGALGDGITDDTIWVNLAITALLTAGGGSLYFPSGTYLITSTILIDISAGISINVYGNGGKSLISYTPIDGTDCFHFFGGAVGISTLHIHDLAYLGANNPGTGNAIRLQRCLMPALIEALYISKFAGGAGIYVESSWLTNIQNVWAQENLYGVLLTNDPVGGGWGSTVNTTIQNCHLQWNGSHGLYVPAIGVGYTINHLSVDNCIIEGNVGGGIVAAGVQNLQLNNLYFELNDATIGDISLERCIFVKIANCGSHFGAPPYQSLTLDANCMFISLAVNNWQGTVSYGGANYVNDLYSSWDTSAGSGMEHQTSNATNPLVVNDTTPTVKNFYEPKFWYTANTVPTLISNFINGFDGQDIVILIQDAVTTFDFTGSNLKGNNGVDYAASNGDVVRAILRGGLWYCLIIK